jgi:TorA maturation chaperone TorD
VSGLDALQPTVAFAARLDPVDAGRAAAYGLLATLLAGPPGDAVLEPLRRLPAGRAPADPGSLGGAWLALGAAADAVEPGRVATEYHDLFIGLTRGEVVPYASWYLSGALMDRPLVLLRRDLAALGFAREAGVREPEDHAAMLCAVMQALLDARQEVSAGQFFRRHLAPWMPRLFADVAGAASADFYAAVAEFGARLMALEDRYWPPLDDNADTAGAAGSKKRIAT